MISIILFIKICSYKMLAILEKKMSISTIL